ncbi:WecB/TagA/CpsF family glycosyltransferase [Glutamicibacter arilaitensis]|uniref:WecB/TagA/CpsF family glycosyltransferase n=1 Tax=Glutamicibacter arilaitensis TaxID=256701 RepID=UPI003FD3E831
MTLEHKKATLTVHDLLSYITGNPVFLGDTEKLIQEFSNLLDSGKPHLVVTANVDHIIDLNAGTRIREAYDEATVRVLDGMPLVWLLKVLGGRNLSRITGADLIFEVSQAARARQWRIAITGGKAAVLETAAKKLSERYPGVEIEAVEMPLLSSAEDEAGKIAVERLNLYKPDVVFVCLGAPKQELWYLQWQEQLFPAIYVGAGAAVDFAAGTKKRAPTLLQRMSLEWVWRMFQEFRRLGPRYLKKGPKFLLIVAVTVFSHFKSR